MKICRHKHSFIVFEDSIVYVECECGHKSEGLLFGKKVQFNIGKRFE